LSGITSKIKIRIYQMAALAASALAVSALAVSALAVSARWR
jgi:hypothetical protein